MSTTTQLFDPCQVEHGFQRVRAMKITCGKCSTAERVPQNSVQHGKQGEDRENQMVARKFTAMGWRVGNSTGRHRCPMCIAAEVQAKPFASLEKIKEAPPMAAASAPQGAAPIREMTREDRRIIFGKLEEVYADEKTGYSGSWTDKRVAEDLGVPRAWVTTMREENFGPDGGNSEINALIAEAKAFLSEIRQVQDGFDKHHKRLATRAEEIATRLASIEKAVRP